LIDVYLLPNSAVFQLYRCIYKLIAVTEKLQEIRQLCL